MVAGDDGVAVGKALDAAGIAEEFFAEVFVVYAPDDLSFGIDFDDPVAVGAANDGVSVSQANGGEGPVTFVAASVIGGKGFENFASDGLVFVHDKVEEVRREVVTIG